jgi:hypothetical protein
VLPEGDIVAYTQRYTFRPDRIECAGELDWLFDDLVPGSRMELLQFDFNFSLDSVVGEMQAWGSNGKRVTLEQTNSKGRNLPPGLDYPLTVEIPLRENAALRIRSLALPPQLLQARFYYNEYPRQIEGRRAFGFKAWEGWPGNGDIRFSNSEPIRFRYEAEIVPSLSTGRTP